MSSVVLDRPITGQTLRVMEAQASQSYDVASSLISFICSIFTRSIPGTSVAKEPTTYHSVNNSSVKGKTISPLAMTEHGMLVDQTARDRGSYKKYSDKELVELELSVDRDKKLVVGSKKTLFHTGGYKLMYVMDSNRKIYVAPAKEGVTYHSSLVSETSDWPIAAGMLSANNGVLAAIDEQSGHFTPMNRVGLVVDQLKRLGAKIDHTTVIQTSNKPPLKRTITSSPFARQKALDTILAQKQLRLAPPPSLDSPTTLKNVIPFSNVQQPTFSTSRSGYKPSSRAVKTYSICKS